MYDGACIAACWQFGRGGVLGLVGGSRLLSGLEPIIISIIITIIPIIITMIIIITVTIPIPITITIIIIPIIIPIIIIIITIIPPAGSGLVSTYFRAHGSWHGNY